MKHPSTLAEKQAKRLQAVHMFEQGLSNAEVARRIGVARKNVSAWYQLWQAGGVDALQVQPPGTKARLTADQWQQITTALADGPQAHGYDTQLWTLERIADLIHRLTGVSYNSNYVAELMHEHGFSCQKPERRAKERNEEAIAGWVRNDWPEIKRGPKSGRPLSSS
jgi:putative transposase